MQAHETLTADIGGTHARFMYGAVTEHGKLVELASRDYSGIDALIEAGLQRLGVQARGSDAVLSLAGPIRQGKTTLTNLGWRIDAAALKRDLGFRDVALLNDLEAAAWALSDALPSDRWELRSGDGEGRHVVISVSTGVGTAYWHKIGGEVQVDAAEGGHVGFAAMDEWTQGLLKALQQQHGTRISWERVLSGSGLAAMDAHLRGGERLEAAEVTRRAKAGEAIAIRTVHHYSQLLGAFAGDLVLAGPATGGVWLMGGVLAGLGDRFDGEAFLKGFDDKGRVSGQLAQVAVQLTGDDRLGLRGAWVLAHRRI